jgi:hypothetical protein
LGKWAGDLTDRLNTAKGSDAKANAWLRARLLAVAAEETPDYDSARQIAWAYRIMYNEYDKRLKKKPGPAARAAFGELEKRLSLTLPKKAPASEAEGGSILPSLGEALKTRGAYQPGPFKAALQKLASGKAD